MKLTCFSATAANDRECNIAYRAVHIQLCFTFFVTYCVALVPAKVASISRAYLLLPVGLCEWKITNVHQILTIKLKKVLRTFEAETFRIFKNI